MRDILDDEIFEAQHTLFEARGLLRLCEKAVYGLEDQVGLDRDQAADYTALRVAVVTSNRLIDEVLKAFDKIENAARKVPQ